VKIGNSKSRLTNKNQMKIEISVFYFIAKIKLYLRRM